MTEVYTWLVSNEQDFIDQLTPDVKRLIEGMKLFPDIDLSDYKDELKRLIKEGIYDMILEEFSLDPEENLIMKQDQRIAEFIEQLQTILLREGNTNGNSHTLH